MSEASALSSYIPLSTFLLLLSACTELPASQLDIFGNQDGLTNTTEPSRSLANQELQDEVKARGGDRNTHAQVNRTVTRNMLGHEPRELYSELDVPMYQRANLPKEAKEALMVGDIAAKNQIIDDDAQGHQAIVESVDTGTQKAKHLFPFW